MARHFIGTKPLSEPILEYHSTLRNRLEWHLNWNSYILQENAFQNVVSKILVILYRLQCVNKPQARCFLYPDISTFLGVRVTKPVSSIPLFSHFFRVIKILVIYWISCSYFINVATSKLHAICRIWIWLKNLTSTSARFKISFSNLHPWGLQHEMTMSIHKSQPFVC